MSETIESRESRRERLKREREERILDAAATVFANKGYHQATIRDIAELADVADGTIYNYFDNKFGLLIGIMTRLVELEQLTEDLTRTQQGDARDSFVPAFRHRVLRLQNSEGMLKAVLPQVLVTPELRDRFYQDWVLQVAATIERYIQTQIDRGHLRVVDAQLAARVMQGMFVGLMVLRILGDKPLQERWEDLPELLATLILDGLSAEGGG